MRALLLALPLAVLLTAPLATPASIPNSVTTLNPPHQTVNAVIGDKSFIQRFGVVPSRATTEPLRLTVHLEYVLQLLESSDVSHLDDATRRARITCLSTVSGDSTRRRKRGTLGFRKN